jgi:hypothetical protein
MTGFMDEPDSGEGGSGRARDDRDVERQEPSRNRRHTDRRPGEPEKRDPRRPTSDDERIDEASEESFPASDPPQQP